VAREVCVDSSPHGELFVARNVGEDLAMRKPRKVSSHSELFVARDTRDITQLTPSGFADTRYPQMDNFVSNHGELFVACDARDITQLTPSGFAATCYPNMDNIHVAATSSGHRKSIRDSSRMSVSTQHTPRYASTCHPNWDNVEDAATSSDSSRSTQWYWNCSVWSGALQTWRALVALCVGRMGVHPC